MTAPARLSLPCRARFDEITPEGSLRTSSYLRWMQDVAWYHSASAGFDMAWYARAGRFWVVRCLELRILRPIRHADVLEVSTEVVGFRRIWARRISEFRRISHGDPFARRPAGAPPEDGHRSDADAPRPIESPRALSDIVATAAIDWVMTDPSGTPVRVPDELLAGFDLEARPIRPMRLDLAGPSSDASVGRSRVLARELDAMGHMNNAAYVDRLEEAVRDAGGTHDVTTFPRRYIVEFMLPAGPRTCVVATTWRRNTGWVVRLADDSGATLFTGTTEPG